MKKVRKPDFAVHERTVAAIDKLMDELVHAMWLGHWQINAVYEWNGIKTTDGTLPAAQVEGADWRYMHAKIRFDVPTCSTMEPHELRDVVIHELLHCLVNEMREDGIDHEERVVSHLQRVVSLAMKRKTNG